MWKAGDKARAVACYAATGTYAKASAISGIPEATLRYWAKQEWFQEELLRADQADTDELKSTFTRIAKIGAVQLEDRIQNGDEVVTKDGEIVRKKIGGKDLAVITAIAADQRRKAMETPDVVSVQNTGEKLASLMQEFIKFNKAKTIEGEPNVQEIPSVAESEAAEEEAYSDSCDGGDETSGSESEASDSGCLSGGASEGRSDRASLSDDSPLNSLRDYDQGVSSGSSGGVGLAGMGQG